MIPAWLLQLVVAAFITALITAIGYFINKLISSLATLTDAINGLKTSSEVIQATEKVKHENIDKRLDKIEDKLNL